MNTTKPKKSPKNVILSILVLIIIITAIYNLFGGSSSNKYSGGEFRCTYCSKVIYNDYRPIHCTNLYNNTYKCDYCGHKNVINNGEQP